MTVTDAYSGDKEWLLGTFPGLDAGPDAHEHFHHDGCFYMHEHQGGREPHHHTYECDSKTHGPGREADCIMPPEVADPDKHRTESGTG